MYFVCWLLRIICIVYSIAYRVCKAAIGCAFCIISQLYCDKKNSIFDVKYCTLGWVGWGQGARRRRSLSNPHSTFTLNTLNHSIHRHLHIHRRDHHRQYHHHPSQIRQILTPLNTLNCHDHLRHHFPQDRHHPSSINTTLPCPLLIIITLGIFWWLTYNHFDPHSARHPIILIITITTEESSDSA